MCSNLRKSTPFSKPKRGFMKKHKLLIALILLVFMIIGAYGYYYAKINYLPDWYTKEPAAENVSNTPSSPETPQSLQKNAQAEKAKPTPLPSTKKFRAKTPAKASASSTNSNTVMTISEQQLNEIIRNGADQYLPKIEKEYLKTVRSNIQPENITIEMIVDTKQIPWKNVPKKYQVAKLFVDQFTLSGKPEVYLKLSGKPIFEKSILSFDKDASITVGRMKYLMKDLLSLPMVKPYFNGQIKLKQYPDLTYELRKGYIVLHK